MKTDLKAKLLQHYIKKSGNKGFTLIELLVVVIIIGILAAVALPSMLNQAGKAREAGARNALGAINRAQQAYRLENSEFAPNFVKLGIGTPAADGYSNVQIKGANAGQATAEATAANTDVNSFCGTVTASGTGSLATTSSTINTDSPGPCP